MAHALTLEQFIGPYKLVERFYEDPARNARRDRLFQRMGAIRVFSESITFFRGQYRVPPLSVRHTFETPFVLADHALEGLVGFGVMGRVWVDSGYRGQRIGPALCADAFLLTPLEKWLTYASSFTPAGLRNRERAYELLVQRGDIQPPPGA